jgi:general secretion pathway protein C
VASVTQALRPDGELFERLAASAPRWVAGVLVVLIGAQLAALLTAPVPQPMPAATAAPVTRNVVDIPSILRANLFGQAASNADPSSAPVTSLAMVLVGVIAASDPKLGFALLGPSPTAVKVYAVGALLPGGARLHSVMPDRVLIDRGGSVESLLMPRRTTAGAAPPSGPAPPAAGAMERMQQVVRDNPGLVGEIIRPQAVLADGKQRGYRVYPGPNQAAFNRLGLRPGDLVVAINGTSLDDPSRGGEVFGTLGSVAEARVTVVRNGSQQDLMLNLAEVANEAERMSREATAPAGTPGSMQPAIPPRGAMGEGAQ